MEAVATSAVPEDFFHPSFEQFYALTYGLKSPEARAMDFSDLENVLSGLVRQ